MRLRLALLLLGALFAGSGVFAQNPRRNRYSVFKVTTAATSEVITVQQPASGAKLVLFEAAQVYCSVACTAEIEVEGTAASTTALTPTAIGNRGHAARATAFHTSNVGDGTTISILNIAAGWTTAIDLSGMLLEGSSTAQNLTIRLASATGDYKVTVIWYEQ